MKTTRLLDFPATRRTPVDPADVMLISAIVPDGERLLDVYALNGHTYAATESTHRSWGDPPDHTIYRFHPTEDGSTPFDMGPRLVVAGWCNGCNGLTDFGNDATAEQDHATERTDR